MLVRETKQSVVGERASLVLIGLASLCAALFYSQFSLNHDSSWYLIATARFLDGATLYRDIIEINPPLAFYLTAPAIAASHLFGITPTIAYFAYCAAIGCVSAIWCHHILHASDLAARQQHVVVFAILVVHFLLPIAEFGQREHLMLLFAMPFFVSQCVLRDADRLQWWHRVGLGVVAALGLLLKPHFLLIPAGIALTRLFQEKNTRIFRDPAYLALAVAGLFYFGFIAALHPAYLDTIVPIAREVYSSYGLTAKQVLFRPELIAFLPLILVIWRGGRSGDLRLQRFVMASLAAAILYAVQFKGWNYQLLPLSAFLVLATAWLVAWNWRELRGDPIYVAALGLVLFMTLGAQLVRGPYQSATTASFDDWIPHERSSVLVLSTKVSAAFPFVNEVSGRWASRYPAQWLIPGALARLRSSECAADPSGCDEPRRILGFARRSIIADVERYRPDVIFVDEAPQKAYFQGFHFDYLEFLTEDRRFDDAFTCYRREGSAIGYGVLVNQCTMDMGIQTGARIET